MGRFILIIVGLFITQFLYGQDQFLYSEKNWIFNSLDDSWKFKESKISNDGSIYYDFSNKYSSDDMTFYFNNCNSCTQKCNMVLINTTPNKVKVFSDSFDSKFTKIGYLKWGDKNKNIYISIDLDLSNMGIVMIKIEPLSN
jgi:hypothetical protein